MPESAERLLELLRGVHLVAGDGMQEARDQGRLRPSLRQVAVQALEHGAYLQRCAPWAVTGRSPPVKLW